MQIQVEIDGKLVEVSKRRLFELAESWQVSPETLLIVDGKETIVDKVKGIKFGPALSESIGDFGDVTFDAAEPVEQPTPKASALSLYERMALEEQAKINSWKQSEKGGMPTHQKMILLGGTLLVMLFVLVLGVRKVVMNVQADLAQKKYEQNLIEFAHESIRNRIDNPLDAVFLGSEVVSDDPQQLVILPMNESPNLRSKQISVVGKVRVANENGARLTREYEVVCAITDLDKPDDLVCVDTYLNGNGHLTFYNVFVYGLDKKTFEPWQKEGELSKQRLIHLLLLEANNGMLTPSFRREQLPAMIDELLPQFDAFKAFKGQTIEHVAAMIIEPYLRKKSGLPPL